MIQRAILNEDIQELIADVQAHLKTVADINELAFERIQKLEERLAVMDLHREACSSHSSWYPGMPTQPPPHKAK